MNSKPEPVTELTDRPGNLLVLALLAPIVGAVSGLLGATFRLALAQADRLRDELIVWAHGQRTAGRLLVTASCTAATAIAAWLVRRYHPARPVAASPMLRPYSRESCPTIRHFV